MRNRPLLLGIPDDFTALSLGVACYLLGQESRPEEQKQA